MSSQHEYPLIGENTDDVAFLIDTGKVEAVGADESIVVAELKGDWSWRPEMQLVDPGYVYSDVQCGCWELYASIGETMPPQRPWMVSAYRGPAERPKRIGG